MSEFSLEPGKVYESISNASAGDWHKCKVLAVDGDEVFVRWLDGPDKGVRHILDADPDYWREVDVSREETLLTCIELIRLDKIDGREETARTVKRALESLYDIGALKLPEAHRVAL